MFKQLISYHNKAEKSNEVKQALLLSASLFLCGIMLAIMAAMVL